MDRDNQKTKLYGIILIASLIFLPFEVLGNDSPDMKNLAWMSHSYWFEGKAEVNYYRAEITKYGIPRKADEFVHILVTEKHKPDLLVKADNWREEGLIDMLKFNYVRRIQTGIYAYNEMISLFFEQKTLQPAKLTFSSQEWCGQSFKELVNFDNISSYHYNTYWDGQGRGTFKVSFPEDLYLYDALPVQLRMLNLSVGLTDEIDLLPSQISSKAKFPETRKATVKVLTQESITVPAGDFRCFKVEVSHPDGKDLYWLESEFPHRMIQWEVYNGDSCELIDSQKIPYWEFNQPGGEKYLPENPD